MYLSWSKKNRRSKEAWRESFMTQPPSWGCKKTRQTPRVIIGLWPHTSPVTSSHSFLVNTLYNLRLCGVLCPCNVETVRRESVRQFGLFLVTRTIFVEKTCWAGGAGWNKEQHTTKYKKVGNANLTWPRKSFHHKLFQQIQTFEKNVSISGKSSEMLIANKTTCERGASVKENKGQIAFISMFSITNFWNFAWNVQNVP